MKKRILQIMSWLLLFTTLVVTPVMAQKPSVCSKEEWEVLKLTNQKKTKSGVRTFIYDEEAAESGRYPCGRNRKLFFAYASGRNNLFFCFS